MSAGRRLARRRAASPEARGRGGPDKMVAPPRGPSAFRLVAAVDLEAPAFCLGQSIAAVLVYD